MAVPDGPGLGVALDRDKVARAHEVYRPSAACAAATTPP